MRFFLVLVAVLSLSSVASAQDGETPLEAGARALLFQIGPDLDLQSFSGGTVSLKWHRTEASARRLGFTVSFDASANDRDANDEGDFERSQVENRQSVSTGASLLFLTYRRSRTPVYLYYGLGPTGGISFFRTERDDSQLPGDDNSDGSIQTAVSTSLGLGGALGVEWVVAPAISLTGEYSTSLTGRYTRVSISTRRFGEEMSTDDVGISLQPGGARLGLSVYF